MIVPLLLLHLWSWAGVDNSELLNTYFTPKNVLIYIKLDFSVFVPKYIARLIMHEEEELIGCSLMVSIFIYRGCGISRWSRGLIWFLQLVKGRNKDVYPNFFVPTLLDVMKEHKIWEVFKVGLFGILIQICMRFHRPISWWFQLDELSMEGCRDWPNGLGVDG